MEKVLIVGSCVSRDAFNINEGEGFCVVDYLARSSLCSAFGVQVGHEIKLNNITSKFQRRMVQVDLEKKLAKIIAAADFDVILFDAIDERFNLFESDSGLVFTLSNELMSSGFKPECTGGRVIESGSEEFIARWTAGWKRFLELLNSIGSINKLRVSRIYWADVQEDGNDFSSANYPRKVVNAGNCLLDKLYSVIASDLPGNQIIDFDRSDLIGSVGHQWGVSPFHYIKPVYLNIINSLKCRHVRLEANMKYDEFELSSLELNDSMRWFEVDTGGVSEIELDAVLYGATGVKEYKALVAIDLVGLGGYCQLPGFLMSDNPSVGSYRYLNTYEGLRRSTFTISLPNKCRKIRLGLRSWWSDGRIELKSLRLRNPLKTQVLISVDVEALPGRAQSGHVDKLIYGRFGSGFPAGIERICSIFDRYGVKCTFFVDFSTIPIHGESGIYDAVDFVASRGHDVQLHMHSEVLVPHMNWKRDPNKPATFEFIDAQTALQCIDYGVVHYEKCFGARPRIFRPGGMKHSRAMYDAVKDSGIGAVSALYRRYHNNIWPLIADAPLLKIENNINEIPLDIPLDPLVCWEPFNIEVRRISESRLSYRTVSLLLHSTSLLYRPRDGDLLGHFLGYHEEYENQLCKYLDELSGFCDFVTHSELLESDPPVKQLGFDQLYG